MKQFYVDFDLSLLVDAKTEREAKQKAQGQVRELSDLCGYEIQRIEEK